MIFVCRYGANKVCLDVFDCVLYYCVLVIVFVWLELCFCRKVCCCCLSVSCLCCICIISAVVEVYPQILLDCFVKDCRCITFHKACLVFFYCVLFSVISCLCHLIIAVEVALKIELAVVFFCRYCANKISLDVFDCVLYYCPFVIVCVSLEHWLCRKLILCYAFDFFLVCACIIGSCCIPDWNPDVLLKSFVKDSWCITFHETCLILFYCVLFSVIGCFCHLIITVEVALKVELCVIFVCGYGANKVCLDILDCVLYYSILIIIFVWLKLWLCRKICCCCGCCFCSCLCEYRNACCHRGCHCCCKYKC